jgi:uncharacterized phage-associated protein
MARANNTMKSRFDERKSTQIAGALLQLAGGKMNYLKLVKLMYIVDREALKRWGYPLTGDEYYSLPHGPIVSRVYDLIADEPGLSSSAYWKDFIQTHDYEVRLARPASDEALAPADTELITEVFQRFGHLDQWQLRDLTHGFPEWRDPGGGRLPIRYVDILRAVGREDEAQEVAGELEDLHYFATVLEHTDA